MINDGNNVKVLALAVYIPVCFVKTCVIYIPWLFKGLIYVISKFFINIFGVTTLETNCSVLMMNFVALCSLPRIAEIGKRRVLYICTTCKSTTCTNTNTMCSRKLF